MSKIILIIKYIVWGLIIGTGFSGCSKEWLEKKPNEALVIPETISELQALLDHDSYMNGDQDWLGEVSCDDHYVPDNTFNNSTNTVTKNFYIWAEDIYEGDRSSGVANYWNSAYRMIMYANTAMEGIDRIDRDLKNQTDWNNVKGSALFYRAFAMYNLNQAFSPVYDRNTAETQLGVPIRLEPEIETPSIRSSISENYRQIITDLKIAANLLPSTPILKTRPSKPAVFALLARVYLLMYDYDNALRYSDSSLKYYSTLLDFNQIDGTKPYPFAQFNDEVIFHFTKASHAFTSSGRVDTTLYKLYKPGDLRKTLFYKINTDETIVFRGSYNGLLKQFSGLSVDEVILIQAECKARLNMNEDALNSINKLLEKRYETGTFSAISKESSEETLQVILEERRKELAFRGLRWSDLRRLNREGKFPISISRNVNGTLITLNPNDPRYTLPIPLIIIELSGIQQNDR